MNISRILFHPNGDYTEAYGTPSLDDDVTGRKPLATIRTVLLEDTEVHAAWERLIIAAHHPKGRSHID